MKKIITTILILIFIGILMYLSGSFVSASFNITEWYEVLRGFMVFVWIIISAFLTVGLNTIDK